MIRDPQTPQEWQAAVDAAEGALAFDSSRMYGLVEGGPTVDVDRCAFILAEGKRRGIVPREGCIERFALELIAGPKASPTSIHVRARRAGRGRR